MELTPAPPLKSCVVSALVFSSDDNTNLIWLWEDYELKQKCLDTLLMVPRLRVEVPKGYYRKFTGSLHSILNFCETPHKLLACVILVSKLDHTFFLLMVSFLCRWVFISCYNKKQVPCGYEDVGAWCKKLCSAQ